MKHKLVLFYRSLPIEIKKEWQIYKNTHIMRDDVHKIMAFKSFLEQKIKSFTKLEKVLYSQITNYKENL